MKGLLFQRSKALTTSLSATVLDQISRLISMICNCWMMTNFYFGKVRSRGSCA